MNKKNNIAFKFTTLLFLVALILPNIVQVLDLESSYTNNENRKYRTIPKFNLNSPIASIGALKNYYLENFGLKTILVNNYIDFKTNALNENPIPNRVAQGKKGWFFLGNNYNNVLNNSFGNNSFTKKDLINTINYLKGLKDYFNSKNIAFYVVIPPDKNKIYQEFLPYKLNQNPTKLDVLKPLLKKKAGIDIIDLSITLKENKDNYPLYLKTDTHWNYYGAFLGYNYTMDVIGKDFSINKVSLDDFKVESQVYSKGDLTKLINRVVDEKTITIKKKIPTNAKLVIDTRNTLYYKNNTQNLKAILFRDSFTNAWIPFFNESFGEIIYHRKYIIDKKEIDTFKPDIVIFEIIERNINFFGRTDIYKN